MFQWLHNASSVVQLSWMKRSKPLWIIQAAWNLNGRLLKPLDVRPVLCSKMGQWSEWEWGRWVRVASGKALLHSSSHSTQSNLADLWVVTSRPWFHIKTWPLNPTSINCCSWTQDTKQSNMPPADLRSPSLNWNHQFDSRDTGGTTNPICSQI